MLRILKTLSGSGNNPQMWIPIQIRIRWDLKLFIWIRYLIRPFLSKNLYILGNFELESGQIRPKNLEKQSYSALFSMDIKHLSPF
jgi:hypothetical protein